MYFFFPLKVEVICQGEGPRTGLCPGQQTQLWPESMRLGGKQCREEPKALFWVLFQLPPLRLKNCISSLFQLILRLLHSLKAEALIKPEFSLL